MTSNEHPTSPIATLEASAAYHIPRSEKPFPAIVGLQGKRLATFSTQFRPCDIEDLLGHDPRSRNLKTLRDSRTRTLYEHVQRKTSEERVRDMLKYYDQRVFEAHPIAGAVSAISIGVEMPIRFEANPQNPYIGNMFIETGRHNRRIVLDGLGRITPLIDLLDELKEDKLDEKTKEKLAKRLDAFSVPVLIFAPQIGQPPLSQEEMEQIFCDFNFRARPVSVKDAMALDHSDPYVELTRYLNEHSSAIKNYGGVEFKAASLGAKSKGIVVQTVLSRFVKGAIEGGSYLEAARNTGVQNPNLTPESADQIKASLVDFLDTFAESMGDKWADRESMHLSSPGWQVVGLLYHDVTFRLGKSSAEMKQFAKKLSELDWKRNGALFSSFMTEKASKRGGNRLSLNSAGASVRRELLKIMREQLELTDLLVGVAR